MRSSAETIMHENGDEHVTSTHKPGKEPTLHSSYSPISLLDTTGTLFDKDLKRSKRARAAA